MRQVSIFCDEAGEQDMSEGYYFVTLVIHDQAMPINQHVALYESRLALGGLPNLPFHMVDLIHGHGDYEGLDIGSRKGLLGWFSAFVRHLPVVYHTFSYSTYDVTDTKSLSARIRRDVVQFLYENLVGFQAFDRIVIYYDEGQQVVSTALHKAFSYMLSGIAIEYRLIKYQDRRLAQVADYLTSVELAAMHYDVGDVSKTYQRFFGPKGYFKKNVLKATRRKQV